MIKPIKADSRWTISKEYTGHASGKPQYVVRFCGEFVGSSQFLSSAITIAVCGKAKRDGALTA